ncbi:Alpha/Beta hydrolase protein, partial [Trametes gibbosa]
MEGEFEFHVPGVDKVCKTWYKVFGDLSTTTPSRRPLVALHGGPGMIHNYLSPLVDLVDTYSIPVILYDQLGNGKSTHLPEKAGDTSFWTEELFLRELEGLLAHLGIQNNFDLYGHSWGGMLGSRFAISHPPGLKRLILANTPASMVLWVEAAQRLRSNLPPDVQAILKKHEDAGTTDSKEYIDATYVFYARHACRLNPMPVEMLESVHSMETDPTVYLTMNGPSEFYITGSIKTWSVLDDLHKIEVPTLLLNGRYDEAQDSVVWPFFLGIPKVKWFTFANSSHTPHLEERELAIKLMGNFLT